MTIQVLSIGNSFSQDAQRYLHELAKGEGISPLNGRKLLFLGSSVTYGSAALGISMADDIRVLDGCEVVKEAVNGTTLADVDADSYLSRLKGLDTNQHFDAVVC